MPAGGTTTNTKAAFALFDRLMRDRAFLEFVGKITGIADLLYDPEYVGGGTHESLGGGNWTSTSISIIIPAAVCIAA